MSNETSKWLNQNTLIGFTAERGTAWHYRMSDQGAESNHYEGEVPLADVLRRLFHWTAESCTMGYDVTGILDSPVQVWKPSNIGRQVIVRSDNLRELGVFKEGYTIHQYREWLVERVHAMAGALKIGSAGLLKGGAQAWVQFEVPETMHTPEGVDFRPHLTACTSHDGTLATTYQRSTTLVVCDNTLAASLGEHGQRIKVYHTKYSEGALLSATEALNLIEQQTASVEDQIRQLSAWEVSDAEWSAFLDEYTKPKQDSKRSTTMMGTKRDRLSALWNNDPRVSPWKGTAWGVLQAVNTWWHHDQIVKGTDGGRAERNMINAITGKTQESDDNAIKLLATVTG